MLKDLCVNFIQAYKLKQLGFDMKCLGYIKQDGDVRLFELMPLDQWGLDGNPTYEGSLLAPLIQQAIPFLLNKVKLKGKIKYDLIAVKTFCDNSGSCISDDTVLFRFNNQHEAIDKLLRLVEEDV